MTVLYTVLSWNFKYFTKLFSVWNMSNKQMINLGLIYLLQSTIKISIET